MKSQGAAKNEANNAAAVAVIGGAKGTVEIEVEDDPHIPAGAKLY